MKEIIFEIITAGYYLSFRKEKFTDILVMDITDGYAGEQCVIEADMPEDELIKLTRFQLEKLKARTIK